MRIRLGHICQETWLELISARKRKSVLLIALILIIIEFKQLPVKVKSVALRFEPTGGD